MDRPSPHRSLATFATVVCSLALATAVVAPGLSGATTHRYRARSLGTLVKVEISKKYGRILVTASGRTLYFLTSESVTSLECIGGCPHLWLPLLTKGRPRAGKGIVAKELGTAKRGSAVQVTYHAHRLYTFSGDHAAGQANGEGISAFGGKWYVISNAGAPVKGALPPNTTTSAAHKPHVMLIVMENHSYSSIVGDPTAPYMNGLIRRYGLATASYAFTHPSLPNYLELVSGSTQGVSGDCTITCSADAPQVVTQLESKHVGWRAYMESAPSPCYTGPSFGTYDRNHNPFVYAAGIVDDHATCHDIVPYSQLAPALEKGTAPPFIWITPDVEHDMHTGSIGQGDAWLSRQLPMVLASSWYRDGGTVIITFDEGTGGTDAGCCTGAAGGHIATIVVSKRTPRGARMSRPVDSAGVLRTIEALYHLPYLGAAASAKSGTLLPLLGLPPASG